jgi:hypothetical protein
MHLNQSWVANTEYIADSESVWTFFAWVFVDFLDPKKNDKAWKTAGDSTLLEHSFREKKLEHIGAESKVSVMWFKVVAEEGSYLLFLARPLQNIGLTLIKTLLSAV